MNGCCILCNAFSASFEIIVIFLFVFVSAFWFANR